MNKPIFKILDDKGRVLIPQPLRSFRGFEKGDVAAITAEKGKITIKKAVVMADDNMPIEAKECYVQSVVREFDGKALTDLLELIAKLIHGLEQKN